MTGEDRIEALVAKPYGIEQAKAKAKARVWMHSLVNSLTVVSDILSKKAASRMRTRREKADKLPRAPLISTVLLFDCFTRLLASIYDKLRLFGHESVCLKIEQDFKRHEYHSQTQAEMRLTAAEPLASVLRAGNGSVANKSQCRIERGPETAHGDHQKLIFDESDCCCLNRPNNPIFRKSR